LTGKFPCFKFWVR